MKKRRPPFGASLYRRKRGPIGYGSQNQRHADTGQSRYPLRAANLLPRRRHRRRIGGPQAGAAGGAGLQNPGDQRAGRPFRLCHPRGCRARPESRRPGGGRKGGGAHPRQGHQQSHRLYPGRLQPGGDEEALPHRPGRIRPRPARLLRQRGADRRADAGKPRRLGVLYRRRLRPYHRRRRACKCRQNRVY